jgi:VWFA-related protein
MIPPRSCGFLTLVVPAMLALALPGQDKQDKQVFRAATDVVDVTVSVRSGKSPVAGLKASDFELTDNGIRQEIDALLVEQVPIDLTLLLDTSPSTADAINRFKTGAQQITTLLRSQDRVRLITFATDVTEIFPFRSGGEPMPVEAVTSQGGTSLHDAVLLALARGATHGRLHLVVAFTDGHDTTSVADGETLAFVAARAGSVLHLVLSGAYGTDYTQPPAVKSLRIAAEESGGEMHPPGRFNDALDAFKRVVDDFRQSYVLRYTFRGGKREGLHVIAVTLKKADAQRYTIRAKKGYFGG